MRQTFNNLTKNRKFNLVMRFAAATPFRPDVVEAVFTRVNPEVEHSDSDEGIAYIEKRCVGQIFSKLLDTLEDVEQYNFKNNQ